MTNEWRPDWRDASKYPNPKKTALKEWAWEFLRRNPNYQADFDLYTTVPLKYARLPSKEYSILQDKDGELHVKHEKTVRGKKSFSITPLHTFVAYNHGIDLLTDPKRSFADTLFSFVDSGNPMCIYDATYVDAMAGMKPEHPGDAIVKISLTRNIDAQIRFISTYLNEQQKILLRHGDLTKEMIRAPRNISTLYPTYLRILDAYDAKIKPAEIAKIIYPEILNDYPKRLGNKSVTNSYNAAVRIRDHEYKNIIFATDDIGHSYLKSFFGEGPA